MGRFPGETSCLTLVWAVLDLLISHETNGIRFTALDRQHLNRTRYTPGENDAPEEVTAAENPPRPGTSAAANLQRQRDTTPVAAPLLFAHCSSASRAPGICRLC